MHPYYIARAIGGLLFLIGALVGSYNIWMTIRTADQPADQRLADRPVPRSQALPRLNRRGERMFNLHYQLERKTIGFLLAIIGVASIGGASRSYRYSQSIRPLRTRRTCGFTRRSRSRAETSTSAKAATPVIRRLIRTLRDEVERYGPYSLAVESKYDHPMLWGSKRTGPIWRAWATSIRTNGTCGILTIPAMWFLNQ